MTALRIARVTLGLSLVPFLTDIVLAERAAAGTPAGIRISDGNRVPACVMPERLMEYLRTRNTNLDPRLRDIASLYRKHGEALRVRWDYAFFQMAIETNFLTYRAGSGRMGDVDPKQNNFAGIGATGGGVPGDRFPDVSSGVLGHLQHLVVYSGERVASPKAERTQLKQDDILSWTEPLAQKRPVTFKDLTNKWAIDRKYWNSIDWVADGYRRQHCGGESDAALQAQESTRVAANRPAARATRVATPTHPPAAPSARPATAVAQPVAKPPASRHVAMAPKPESKPDATTDERMVSEGTRVEQERRSKRPPASNPESRPDPSLCRVWTASYGGQRSLLIQMVTAEAVNYTVLGVNDGREEVEARAFINGHAPGGTLLSSFEDQRMGLREAYRLCPKT